MNRSQWLLSIALTLTAAACGGRTGKGNGLPPNTAAIDFFNDSSDTIRVYINNENPIEMSPNSSVSLIRNFGLFQVAIDDTGDDLAAPFPFQNIGLEDQQRTVMVYRSRRGTRPLIGAESAVAFHNDSLATAAVYFNNINYGSVPAGQTQIFNVPSGRYNVTVDLLEDGLAIAYPVQQASFRPQSLTAMTFR